MRSPMLHACFLALIAAAPEDVSQEPAATATPSCLEDPSNSTSSSDASEESESDGTGTSQESNQTDDYYPQAECLCPVFVLRNTMNSTSKPPGCIYSCESKNCTIPDGEACYNISFVEYKNMKVNQTQNCLLGSCQNGTCVPDGQEEQCYQIEA
uniref:Evasin n=1 Tax=Amblyomma tuberculatum TaxID=48802 RepID=A0A6M2E879_9ACAR